MRCRGCGYSLWNVPGRTCPECGVPFLPSDFIFEPNAVEFCCPGCGQQYYGIDPQGLIVPRDFDCVRCGARCNLETMILRAAPGTNAELAEQEFIPWDRGRGGRIRRFVRTVSTVLGSPGRIGEGLRRSAPGNEALWFGLLSVVVAAVPQVCVVLLIVLLESFSASTNSRSANFASSSLSKGLKAAGWSAGIAFGTLLAAIAMAFLAFGILRLLGERPDWRRVLGSYGYGLAPLVLGCIPLCGFYLFPVAGIWCAIATAIVLAGAISAPVWKTVVAVLGPIVLCIGLGVGMIVVSIVQAAPVFTTPAAPPAGAGAPAGSDADPDTGSAPDAGTAGAEPMGSS
ncbi:MAG: Yip1 family protein [Phycisphaerales bacterium]